MLFKPVHLDMIFSLKIHVKLSYNKAQVLVYASSIFDKRSVFLLVTYVLLNKG